METTPTFSPSASISLIEAAAMSELMAGPSLVGRALTGGRAI
jgi:hypothetical protein|tara:strand:+ start:96 stop:221 length:126 start_codon:yes stop_codon:yes gene_type:complete